MKLTAFTILIVYVVSTNGDLLDQPLTDHELDLLIEAVGAMDLMGMSSMRKKEVTHCLTSNKISSHGYGYGDHRVKRAAKGAKEIVSYCFGGSSKKSQAQIGGGGHHGGKRPCPKEYECCMEWNVLDGDHVSNPDCPKGYGCDALGGNQCFENPCTTARCADNNCIVTQSETEPGPNLHWLAWQCPCIDGADELYALQQVDRTEPECPDGADCCRQENVLDGAHVENPNCGEEQLCDAFQGLFECYDNPCLNDLNVCDPSEKCVVLDLPPIFIVADCLCEVPEVRPCSDEEECCMEWNVIDGDQVSNPDCPEGYGCDALGGNQCFENPCTTARCADAGCEVTQSETEPGPNLHWLAWKCPCINGLLELDELQDYENPFNQIDEECPEGAECCRDNNFIIDDHVSNPDCDVGQLCDAFQGGYECYDNPCLEVNDLNPCESRELCVVLDQPPIFIVADCLCAADEADE